MHIFTNSGVLAPLSLFHLCSVNKSTPTTMKLKVLLFATAVFFISCSNDKKTAEVSRQVSALRSDMLMQSVVNQPFARPSSNDLVSLTISGPSLLKATATFKVVNEKGEEIHCETFPSKDLIQADYRTANSVLQEAHLRDVVKGFFVEDQITLVKQKGSYAGL